MILIDKHGNKLEVTERCPKCGSDYLRMEVAFENAGVDCDDCGWYGGFWDLAAFVEELPVERQPER